MPRFVRPAYITVDAETRRSGPIGTGPRSRDGWLTAQLTLRERTGGVSPAIRIDAGGRHSTTGAGRAEISIPEGFTVEIERTPRPSDPTRERIAIVIHPE